MDLLYHIVLLQKVRLKHLGIPFFMHGGIAGVNLLKQRAIATMVIDNAAGL